MKENSAISEDNSATTQELVAGMEETSESMFKQLGIEDETLKTWKSVKENAELKAKVLKCIVDGEPYSRPLNLEKDIDI